MEEALIRAVNGSDRNTSTTNSPFSERKFPLVGYPGPVFAAFHLSALTSTTISTVVSAILIIYLCGCTCRRKPSKANTKKEQSVSGKQKSDGTSGDSDIHTKIPGIQSSSMQRGKPASSNNQHIRYFWKWNVGERFVLYIAACDLGLGISESINHTYIYHVADHPPDLVCAFVAFLSHQFAFGEWFLVTLCAMSACSLVVFGKKLSLGRWDWRLFVFAFVFPLVDGIFGIVFRMFGASVMGCYTNEGTIAGRLYTMVIPLFQVVLYIVVAVAYATIWFMIRRTTGLLEESSTNRYQNSARKMMIFVAAFIFQWWLYTFATIWILIDGNPPPALLVLQAILANLGGVYNCFAYTIIRRQLQKQTRNSGTNVVVVSDGRKPKDDALDRAPTSAAKSVTIEDTTTKDSTAEMAVTTIGPADSSMQHQSTRI